YRKSAGTVVTVIEGRVAVGSSSSQAGAVPSLPRESLPRESLARKDGAAPRASELPVHEELPVAPDELLLMAGEQVVVHPTAIETPKPASVAVATAWTDQKVIFESTPLREAVEEFNRYNRQQLVIRDPELYD